MVLFFSYRVVNNAMNKIIVVNEGGEFVHFKAMQTDKLFESLLKSHCYYTAYYLNSFDRLTIEENQARGLFLVNKSEANTISQSIRQTVLTEMHLSSGLYIDVTSRR